MFEEAQAQMEAAEAIAQEALELAQTFPIDTSAIAAKQAEYGVAFVNASAAIAEATYAEEDPVEVVVEE